MISTNGLVKIAVLDDYQHVALKMADWTPLHGRATITVFNDHLADPDRVVERSYRSMSYVSCASGRRFRGRSSNGCPA